MFAFSTSFGPVLLAIDTYSDILTAQADDQEIPSGNPDADPYYLAGQQEYKAWETMLNDDQLDWFFDNP